jgi:hypothetical protein
MRLFNISSIKVIYHIALSMALASCSLISEDNSLTTAEGLITNRYTSLPVAGAAVTVGHRSSGFGYRNYDSLTTVYSDAAGHYAVSFTPAKQGKSLTLDEYVIHVLYSPDLFDLTSQPYAYPWNGIATKLGKANKINLEVTPYKQVTIKVPAGKSGESGIHLDFASTDQENWFGNIILADTIQTTQFIGFTRTIRVLPNRDYRFYRHLFGKGGNKTDSQARRVLYTDTTTIVFR